jgi:L-lactate dehydrogenase (cytochrome)
MAPILSIDDLRQLARRRIPRAIFDYAAGGSYEELTLRRNSRRSRCHDVSPTRDGRCIAMCRWRAPCSAIPVSMPLAIGPTGLAGLFHADGEILARGPRPPAASRTA